MGSEPDEYESLLEQSSAAQHMIAGACAGVMEHTLVYPVDCVKTRLQCLRPLEGARYRGLLDGLRTIVVTEGIGRTLRGVGAVVFGAGPAHALYFASYEQMKLACARRGFNDQIGYGLSAVGATVLHDSIMTPADAVKQRVQVYRSPYSNSLDCFRAVLRSEGLAALYRAYTTQLVMNIPFHVVHFNAYELAQDYVNSERHYAPSTHVISGAIAGACAAACTNPLDVCKTLLNTQEQCALQAAGRLRPVASIGSALRTVYRLEGFAGYFKGVQARVVFQMPGTAISWLVYETFKWYLSGESGRAAATATATAAAAGSQVNPLVIDNRQL
ncbi:hypothetical protein BOX15_Mlig034609g4 [Macrostomum lignano]|uniref:Uncharacterized protein n=2 Tax=Macrostomum lignano TaxID=282301 RepID=A0A267DLY2_9PLAT|nr:hypothetical protein BOX15_Mlig034609g3 [Macrostomum lignano]PAA54592.1 hypothetical protein BOX15_Mlig034609g1 [Macrostomum lignano]PAA92597.1 hypothetical protein BOX15_Mlig034609g4 [Macrostomum lignano]